MDLAGAPRPPRRTRRFLLGSATLAVALLSVPAVALATHLFSDVPDGHPHAEGIGYVAQTGVTQGCDDSRYCPGDELTRAQMGTFLYRASGNDPATPPSVNAATLDGQTAAQLRQGVDAATVGGQTPAQLKQGGNAATLQDASLLALLETSIPVGASELSNGSTLAFSGATHGRGINLPESATSPRFATSFSVPSAKPPEAETYLDVTWNTAGWECSMNMQTPFVQVRRPGVTSVPPLGLTPVGGAAALEAPSLSHQTVVTRYHFTNPSGDTLEPGDTVLFAQYRSTAGTAGQPDTCTSDMYVTGLAVRYG